MAKRGRKQHRLFAYRDVRLAMQIDGFQRGKRCSIRRACKLLAKGKLPPPMPVRLADGTWVVIPQTFKWWKGRNHKTLRQRYHEGKRDLK